MDETKLVSYENNRNVSQHIRNGWRTSNCMENNRNGITTSRIWVKINENYDENNGHVEKHMNL